MQELEHCSKWRDNKNKATMWEKAQRQSNKNNVCKTKNNKKVN